MPYINNEKIVSCDIQSAYDVVQDITKYNEFIPWCKNVKIISNCNSTVVSDVQVEFLFIKEKYRSMTKFTAPTEVGDEVIAGAEITIIEGPFKHFLTTWHLKGIGINRTLISFNADFSFNNRLYNSIASLVVQSANQKIIDAFSKRVKKYKSI